MKHIGSLFGLIVILIILADLNSCTDPLPPRIDPYENLRTGWFFIPGSLKTDTLITSTDPQIMVSPVTIAPYLVNEWDEWIVDTNYVEVRIKMTLLNSPEVQQEYIIRDTTAFKTTLTLGDSAWASFDWPHRLNGKPVYRYLPSPTPNFEKSRQEWEVARIRLEGTIQLFKNVLPKPLPPKDILILYWVKLT